MSTNAVTKGVVLYMSSVPGSIAIEKNQDRVRFLLDAQKVTYQEIDIAVATADKDYMHAHSTNAVKTRLPQVFKDGKYVGTTEEIEEANEAGELKSMLDKI